MPNYQAFMQPPVQRWTAFMHSLIVLLAAAIAVSPLVMRGPSCGDDFHFHLASWLDAQSSWRLGIPYPHWAFSPNFAAGEPRFVFYPPLTWMLGAALGFLLPWKTVPLAMTLLFLAGTGFANRQLARQYLPEPAATLAGCIAIFFGYSLYSAYERTAFAELSGGIWIPLLLMYVLRERNVDGTLRRRVFDGSTLPLALVLAGAWLSNAPVGVMASYLLPALALLTSGIRKSWVPVLRTAVAAPLGIAVAAIYLLPAALEQRWVDIRQATDVVGARIEDNWLFERLHNPLIWWHDRELLNVSIVAAAMVTVALLSALLLRWQPNILDRRIRTTFIVIALTVLFLQFPISRPLWNLLPKLRFLQFPWRWLLVLEAPMAILAAAAVWTAPLRLRRLALGLCGAAFLLCTAVAGHTFFISCNSNRSVATMLAEFKSGKGIHGTPEYAPIGTADTDRAVLNGMPGACLLRNAPIPPDRSATNSIVESPTEQLNCAQIFTLAPERENDGVEHLRVAGTSIHSGYLLLRLTHYPAWRISVNNQVASAADRQDGLIAIAVPEGPISVSIDWTTTPDTLWGRWISLVAVMLALLLWLFEKHSRKHGLVSSGTSPIHLPTRLSS